MFLIFCPWSETHLREAVAGWWGLVLGLAGERALAGWDRICWSLSKMDMWWRLQTFILATTGPRTNHHTQPRSGSASCWTRLINNLIAPPRFAPHCSTAVLASGNNCESGSDGAAVNWFLIISRNSLESHEFLECHLSVIWWFVESSWCWSVVGLSALTLLICVDAVRNQNAEKYNYFQPSYRWTLGTLRPERSETAATAAHCARQLCSGGIVWLHDKISRITIWGQSCTSPAQPSPAQPSIKAKWRAEGSSPVIFGGQPHGDIIILLLSFISFPFLGPHVMSSCQAASASL